MLLFDEWAKARGSGGLEASVEEKLWLDKWVRGAIFRYVQLDVIMHKDEFQFGTWNNWPLQWQ